MKVKVEPSFEEWEIKIKYRGLDFKYLEQLEHAGQCYKRKIPLIEEQLIRIACAKTHPELFPEIAIDSEQTLIDKLARLKEKYACILKEQEFREKEKVNRQLHGTVYYIDLTNGNDARTGLKIGNYIIDSTADTTHFVDASLTGADDYIKGSYVWNVTRSAGSLIAGFVAATDTVTLASAIAGMAKDDEYYILDAWKTIKNYTSVTVRSAGDIAWVRANTTETVGAANIAFDEDGTINNYIEIRGCSATAGEDPWGDGSAVKPIIDFNAGAYYLDITTDHYWRLYRLEIINGSSATGIVYNNASHGTIIDSCYVHDNTHTAGRGIQINVSDGVTIRNCALDDNYAFNLYCAFSRVYVENSTLDGGGTNSTNYGLAMVASFVECVDTKFGDSAAHDNGDVNIFAGYFGIVHLRNCKLANPTEVVIGSNMLWSYVSSEDHDQVKGTQKTYYYVGIVERDSSIPLDSLDSAKMSPNANCGAVQALTLSNGKLDGDYQIWCPASATTITIKARETAAWAANPSATQFYFEASYLDEAATSAHRATQVSAQSLSGTTEISFTMTFTPAQAGWVYVTCYLKKYEASKYVNVSVKPTVS